MQCKNTQISNGATVFSPRGVVRLCCCPSKFCQSIIAHHLNFFNDNETAAFNFQNGCYIRRCSSQVPPVNNEEPLMLLYKL